MNTKWDRYFYNICNVVAENSNCYSRKVGAIIVKDKTIISTGYNGPARGILDCSKRNETTDKQIAKEIQKRKIIWDYQTKSLCPRQRLGYPSGEGLHICIAAHGERNAIVQAARNGIAVKDCQMYMNCNIPCKDCLVEIINAGISEIIVTEMKFYDDASEYILANSGLLVRKYMV